MTKVVKMRGERRRPWSPRLDWRPCKVGPSEDLQMTVWLVATAGATLVYHPLHLHHH